MYYLASARLRSGQLAEAEVLLREAEKRWRATASENRRLAAAILPSLAECLVKLSHHTDAERLAREYLTLAANGSLRPWSKAEASGLLGAALLAQGRWAQAEAPLTDALGDLQTNYARVPAHIGPRLRQSLGGWLMEYARASGRSELVEEWRRWTNAVGETKE